MRISNYSGDRRGLDSRQLLQTPGNPVCTAARHVVLKDKLQHNAHVVGSYLKERHTALEDKYETIGDARGWEFMLGVLSLIAN